MKRAVILAIFLALLSTLALPGSIPAEASGPPTWTSIVAYFNPNPGPPDSVEELGVAVYRSEESPPLGLPQGVSMRPFQSGVLLIGQIIQEPGFKGSAVISSSVPVVAVYKQAPADNIPYSPILYTSFDMSQTGQGKVYIPSLQRSAAYDSQIGVQNVEGGPVLLSLRFYGADGNVIDGGTVSVPANRSYVFKASDYFSEDFNGSAIIEGQLESTGLMARLVAAVQEVQGGGRRAYAFEGVASGSTELVMPSAGCQAGETLMTSSYTVQNVGGDATDISVSYYYYDDNGELQSVATTAGGVEPGFSAAFSPCDEEVAEELTGRNLTAIIRSTGENIAAVCRLSANNGLMTAFLGQPIPASGAGVFRLLLPYVEWSPREGGIHTELLVMNPTDSPADDVRVIYYARSGSVAATHVLGAAGGEGPLPPYTVRTSNPSAMRIVGARGFAGAAIIESSQPVVALARVTRSVDVDGYTLLGDDYNAIPNNP